MWKNADMFRLCKKCGYAVCAAAIVSLPASSISCYAQEENGSVQEEITGSLMACDEDEYVLLDTGNNHAEIYDSQGTYMGRCTAYLGEGYGAAIVKKDQVLNCTSDDTSRVFSMAELQMILELPEEDYSVQVFGSVYLVTDRHTGRIWLYDCHGECLYDSEDGNSENESLEEGSWYGMYLAVEGGYLIGSIDYSDDEDNTSVEGPVWVRADGQETREITDFRLSEAFFKNRLDAFGENLLIYDWDTETGSVYDLGGELLLDQAATYILTYEDDIWNYDFSYGTSVDMVLLEEDGMYMAYDTQLQECAMFPVPEKDYWYAEYKSGFLKGAFYQQLDDRKCAGFVEYQGRSEVPYARTGSAYLVYADDQLLSVPVDEGGTLLSLNETYAVVEYQEGEDYIDYLIDLQTGETLMSSGQDGEDARNFDLGSDYCIIRKIANDGSYNTSITILDSQKQEICHADRGNAYVWKNDHILLERGIYHGIADRDGNWIIRTINGEQE